MFKSWDSRLDRELVSDELHNAIASIILYCFLMTVFKHFFFQFVESDVDEELLLYVP